MYLVALVDKEEKQKLINEGYVVEAAEDHNLIGPDQLIKNYDKDDESFEAVAIYFDCSIDDMLNPKKSKKRK